MCLFVIKEARKIHSFFCTGKFGQMRLIEMVVNMVKGKDWEAQHSALCLMKSMLNKQKGSEELERLMMDILISMVATNERKLLHVLPDCYYEMGQGMLVNDLFIAVKRPLVELITEGLKFDQMTPITNIETSKGSQTIRGSVPIVSEGKITEYRLEILRKLIEGGRGNLRKEIDAGVLRIFIRATISENRFFRELGYKGLVEAMHISHLDVIDTCREDLTNALDRGLMDHWSEVRLAASMVSLQFLTMEEKRYSQDDILRMLLPKMALNRHHAADRIRSFSRDAWYTILGPGGGKKILADNIDETINYYIGQLDADNSGVREAACHSLCEITTSLGKNLMESRIGTIVARLMVTIRDDSWAVREGACFAIGESIENFPLGLANLFETDLFDLLLAHLSDNAGSVRGASAAAMAKGVLVYPVIGIGKVLEVLDELLILVRQQAFDSQYRSKAGETKFEPSEKKR
jgi:hypothetical protein